MNDTHTIPASMVEAAARALHATDVYGSEGYGSSWETLTVSHQDEYRERVRAVLAAVLPERKVDLPRGPREEQMRTNLHKLGLARTSKGSVRRHPAEVTMDRLGAAVDRWHDRFDPTTLDEISHVMHALECIAEDVTAVDTPTHEATAK